MRIFCRAIIYAAPRDEHVSIIFCVNCSEASHVDQCNKRYLNTNDQETLNILRNSVTFFFKFETTTVMVHRICLMDDVS